MKQMEVTEKQIGENLFYIKKFAAFTAANISGDLAALITPLIGGVVPAIAKSDESKGALDMDIEDAMPGITSALSSLSGDKFESLMKKLLIDHRNISVANPQTGNVEQLTMDLANEVFCGEVQDMFILCFEVIKLNFNGFFKKIGARFGNLQGIIQKVTAPNQTSGDTSI